MCNAASHTSFLIKKVGSFFFFGLRVNEEGKFKIMKEKWAENKDWRGKVEIKMTNQWFSTRDVPLTWRNESPRGRLWRFGTESASTQPTGYICRDSPKPQQLASNPPPVWICFLHGQSICLKCKYFSIMMYQKQIQNPTTVFMHISIHYVKTFSSVNIWLERLNAFLLKQWYGISYLPSRMEN